MKRITIGLFLACSMLFSACSEDGLLPPNTPQEGLVALRVGFTSGSQALGSSNWPEDATGSKVRFSQLKFFLAGVQLWNADSVPLEGVSTTVLLLDASMPNSSYPVGVIP